MKSREEWLEHNVARLLARSWTPIVPREAFRLELVRRVGAAVVSRKPRAQPARFDWRAAVALAAALVLATAAFVAYERSTARGLDDPSSWLASHRAAVLRADGWYPLEARDDCAQFVWTDERELATPSGVRAVARLDAGAKIEFGAESSAVLARTADGAPRLRLLRGELLASRGDSTAGDWRVSVGPSGSRESAEPESIDPELVEIDLARGDLSARLDAGCAVLKLLSGNAVAGGSIARRALEVGVVVRSCDQRSALAPAPDPAVADQRAPLAALPETAAADEVDPQAQIAGTVVDAATRAPIDEFAVVLVPALRLPRIAEPIVREFHRAHGRFAVAGVESGSYALWVRAAEHAAFVRADTTVGVAPLRVDVALERGRSVVGRVTESGSGRAITGAVILSERDVAASVVQLSSLALPAVLGAQAASDAEGLFELDHLRAGATSIRVTAPGHSPRWIPVDLASQLERPIACELVPGGSVRGRVETDDGSAAPDIGLVAVPMDAGEFPLYWAEMAVTDASGEFSIADLPTTQCVIVKLGPIADRARWTTPETRYAEVVAGREVRVDFTAGSKGVHFFGRVLDAQGHAVAGRGLTLSPSDYDGLGGMESRWRTTTTDATGAFDLRDVAAGDYELYVAADLPMEVVQATRITLGRGGELEREIRVGPSEIHGHATISGEPVAKFTVIVERKLDGGWDFVARVFGSAGAFRVPMLNAGEFRALIIPEDGAYAVRRVEPFALGPGESRELAPSELELGAQVRLTVVDSGGAPVSNARVRVFDPSGEVIHVRSLQLSDASGELELVALPAGRVGVAVEKEGMESSRDDVELRAGDSLALRVVLRPKAR